MSTFQQITILGHLGKDPECRVIDMRGEELHVADLSIATTETWKDARGTKHQRTEWHSVQVWGNGAKAAADHLHKGDPVLVTGKLRTETWTDKEGVERRRTRIVADPRGGVVFVGGGSRTPRDDRRAPRATSRPYTPETSSEEPRPNSPDDLGEWEAPLCDNEIPF